MKSAARRRREGCFLAVFVALLVGAGIVSGQLVVEVTVDGEAGSPPAVFRGLDDSVILRCRLTGSGGDRVATVRWLRNDRFLTTNESGYSFTTSAASPSFILDVLQLTPLSAAQYGSYSCAADTRSGTMRSLPVRVQAQQTPVFQSSSSPVWSPVEPRTGESARLNCGRVTGRPIPQVAVWQNDLPLDLTADRFTMLPSGVLQISDVQSSDEAVYLCVASNRAGNAKSRPARLSTTSVTSNAVSVDDDESLLSVLAVPQNKTVNAGDNVTFECLFQRSDLINVTWLRLNDLPLPQNRAKMVHTNLHIDSVSTSDQGLYMCKADIPNHSPLFVNASLNVLVPPRIVRPPKDVFKPEGHTARFECYSTGTPAPTFVWLKNGVAIKLGGRFKTVPLMTSPPSVVAFADGQVYKRDLLIGPLRSVDDGVYQCVVENDAGRVTAHARYRYQQGAANNDGRITDVTARARDNTANGEMFDFELTVPTLNLGQLTEATRMRPWRSAVLLVNYHPTNTDIPGNTVTMECNFVDEDPMRCRATCCAHFKFEPFTNYTFALRSFIKTDSSGKQMMSKSSEELIVQSADGVAKKSIGPSVEQLLNGVIRLEWSAPTDTDAFPGKIQQYRIEWRRTDGVGESQMVQIPYVVQQYNVDGLESNTSYEFRVVPSTRVGFPRAQRLLDSDNYSWTRYTTMVANGPFERILRSPRIETRALNSSSALIEWSFEPPTQNMSRVKLVYTLLRTQNKKSESHDSETMLLVDAEQRSVVLSGLAADSVYRVTVNGVDRGNVDGLESSKNVETPSLSVAESVSPSLHTPLPEAPLRVNCFTNTNGGASLHWQRSHSSRIAKYLVRLTPLPENPKALINVSLVEMKQTTKDYLKLNTLIPGRRYIVAVRSQDTDGFIGPYSADVICQSRDPDVSESQELHWGFSYQFVNESSLLLVWNGFPAGVDGEAYVIKYSTKPVAEWTDTIVNKSQREYLLSQLNPGEYYFLKIGAVAADGSFGQFSSPPLIVAIPSKTTGVDVTPRVVTRTSYKEGLLIGMALALLVLIVCCMLLLCRKCRVKSAGPSTCHRRSWRNWLGGRRPVLNANGVTRNGKAALPKGTPNGHHPPTAPLDSAVELQTLLPTVVDANAVLDAKGGDQGPQPSGSARLAALGTSPTLPTAQQERKSQALNTVQVVIGNGSVYGDFTHHQNEHQPTTTEQPPQLPPSSQPPPSLRLSDLNSDPSHSPVTASSLHSWSHDERHSQPTSSSLPNLTDSGIGFEEPRGQRPAHYPLSIGGETTVGSMVNGGGRCASMPHHCRCGGGGGRRPMPLLCDHDGGSVDDYPQPTATHLAKQYTKLNGLCHTST